MIVYKRFLPVTWNLWKRIIVSKLLVLDRNTWNHVTVQMISIL